MRNLDKDSSCKFATKKNLDLKGENIKAYKTGFDSAFTMAHNIALYYFNQADKVDGGKKTVDDLDYDG